MIGELLKNNDVKTALIVDDAYDTVPTSDDLSIAEDDWFIFFDDLDDTLRETIIDSNPLFTDQPNASLIRNDVFVAELWRRRDTLPRELVAPIFEVYVQDMEHDSGFVHNLRDRLRGYGLAVSEIGRDFVEAGRSSDLIVIDLYLGATQKESDIEVAVSGLAEIVSSRPATPPLILLMSRSERLPLNTESFRDRTQVFTSGFRAIKKADIGKPGRLDQLLVELARHRSDSLRLSIFAQSWRCGISAAIESTIADIRKLDLSDWAQIRDLLLSHERVSTGSYLLDVFDLVLLHEVERDQNTIDAAFALNSLNSDEYPPTTMAASTDTLSLVFKTLYKHHHRLALDSETNSPVMFGDILGISDNAEAPPGSIFADAPQTVFVVMTPACDLQRNKAERALLMAGRCTDLDATVVNPFSVTPRTPILKLGVRRVCVDWQPHHIAALTYEELNVLMSEQTGVRIIGRLRDANAVSIQQELLSNLGRVGLVAPMPSTFRVDVYSYYPKIDSTLEPVIVDGEECISGVCFVGRDDQRKIARVPFDSSVRFSFFDSLNAIADASIHTRSRQKIVRCRSVDVIDVLFSNGIRLDVSKTRPQDWKAQVAGVEEILGKVVFRSSHTGAFDGPLDRAGLIFEVVESSFNHSTE